jgi:hypothetical protein
MQRENGRHCTTIVVKIAGDDGTGKKRNSMTDRVDSCRRDSSR